ncbi:MAG: hypothetical protein AAF750_03800 [Planctomycetota bacterium]
MCKRSLCAAVMATAIGLQCFGEPDKTHHENYEPESKFEEAQRRDGVLTITRVYDLPAPDANYGTIRASLLITSTRDDRRGIAALKLSYQPPGRDAVEQAVFIDEDELVSLTDALEYMIGSERLVKSRSRTFTRVEYRSRDGFMAGFSFEPEDKTTGYFLETGGDPAFMPSLASLLETVEAAQTQLDDAR